MQLTKRLMIAAFVIITLTLLTVVIDWQSLFAHLLDSFQQQQRDFHDRLATDMHAIKDTGSWLSGLALISIGFLYGIFHAVGPGHGKLVVTSYMLAEKNSLRRGIIVVALSSLLQALVAIAVVLGLFYLLGLARTQTEHAAVLLEGASFTLIALMGLRLIWRGIKEFRGLRKPHHHDHAHHNDHDHHEHHHDEHCGCGHSHMPTPQELAQAKSSWSLVLMVLSIGIRPCSGAIILLLFACLIGTILPGVIATLAMSVGTAITTAALAIAAVQSKNWLLKHMQSSDLAMALAHAGCAIAGGLLIALMGLFFAIASAQAELQRSDVTQEKGTATMHLPQRPLEK